MKPIFKRSIIILIVIASIFAIIFILMQNKSKMETKAKSIVYSGAIPVKVAEVTKLKLDDVLSYTGTTFPYSEVVIISETQGKVLSIHYDVGDYVQKGKLLVQTDTVLKYASYLNAKAAYEKAKSDLARFEKLYSGKSINEAQLDQAKFAFQSAEAQLVIAKKQLKDTRIYAPASGIVTSRSIEAGSVISPGFAIGNIIDISSLKIKVNVAEKDAFMINTNQKVTVETDVYKDKQFIGSVKSINSKADEAHTYNVEIVVRNEKQFPLKAGMFAKVLFAMNSDSSIAIPREALIGSVKNPQCYVLNQDSTVVLKDIIINGESDKYFGVAQGLELGDKVVVNGQINLKNNSKVIVQ